MSREGSRVREVTVEKGNRLLRIVRRTSRCSLQTTNAGAASTETMLTSYPLQLYQRRTTSRWAQQRSSRCFRLGQPLVEISPCCSRIDVRLRN